MHPANRFPLGPSILLLSIFSGLAGCAAPRPDIAQASGGILDLRNRDFSGGESVPLTGLWDFLPGSVDIPYDAFKASPTVLRKVPDLWKGSEAGGTRGHGSGTYHLTVLLPPGTPPLALRYLSASTSLRIEVQGKSLVQVGLPSADPLQARAAYKPGFARLDPVGDRLDIMVRVSNYVYRNGGLWYPIFLGSAASIESGYLSDLAVTVAQSMALAVMSLTLLLLFYLRRKNPAFLYSGLLALLLALRLLVTGDYMITSLWPRIPFDLMIRMEYLTAFIPFPIAIEFFCVLFPRLMGARLKWACILPPSAFVLLALVLPLDPLTRSLFAFYVFAIMNIVILSVTVFAKTVLKSDREGIAIFIGALVLALSVINDIFYSSFVWWTGNLAPWGFCVFVGFLVVIMVKRMTTDFAEVEELLERKELMIKEIHHRVKNSLQVVASLLSLQSNHVDDPETKEVFALLRMRIISMSLVHEKLYGKVGSDSLDLGDYLRDLIGLLISKDRLESVKIDLKFKAQAVEAGVDSCFNAGLIMTELVSNALKYGLLPKGGGSLGIEMTRIGASARILVEDDGPGFPPGFRLEEVKTLGYKLITSIINGNHDKLEILPGPGGRVMVELGIGGRGAR